MTRLAFADDFNQRRLTWSRPDSPMPAICSYCAGALPEVPLMFWNSEGACIALCDACVKAYIKVVK